MAEKRKNDAPLRSGWWLLLIGFVLGVVVTLGAVSVLGTSNSSPVAETQQDLPLTATQLIQEATGTASVLTAAPAQATPAADLDPLFLTATAIIQQATQQAASD